MTPVCHTKAQGILKLGVGLCASAVLLYIAREKLSLCNYGDFAEEETDSKVKIRNYVCVAGGVLLLKNTFFYLPKDTLQQLVK